MATIPLVLFYLFFPLVILYLSNKFRFLNQIGPVVVAYTIGMILGNTGLLSWITERTRVQELLTITTIPIAIPLLLFSMDLKKWSGMAGKTFLSMILALVAVVTSVFAGFFIFRNQGINNLWDISGMLAGLYTGSTPNLAVITQFEGQEMRLIQVSPAQYNQELPDDPGKIILANVQYGVFVLCKNKELLRLDIIYTNFGFHSGGMMLNTGIQEGKSF